MKNGGTGDVLHVERATGLGLRTIPKGTFWGNVIFPIFVLSAIWACHPNRVEQEMKGEKGWEVKEKFSTFKDVQFSHGPCFCVKQGSNMVCKTGIAFRTVVLHFYKGPTANRLQAEWLLLILILSNKVGAITVEHWLKQSKVIDRKSVG